MEDDILEQATQDLEKSLAEDQQQEETEQNLGDAIVKAIKSVTTEFLGKAQTTDLSADKDRRGSLTETSKDPATSPKKTGREYPDSSKYEARKGSDMDDDFEGDDEDDAPKGKGKKLSKYAMKMKKMKKMKKSQDEDRSYDDDDDVTEDMVDATEAVAAIGESTELIGKSLDRLEDGMSVFGELLGEMSDPKRDKILVNIAKGISFLVDQQKELNKSIREQNDLMKSIGQMPGVPRVAGLHQMVKTDEVKKAEGGGVLKKGDKDRLFKAAVQGQISMEEFKEAQATGDASILEKVK